jgi:uncharacterized membrane protein YhaH (DUF805 family)
MKKDNTDSFVEKLKKSAHNGDVKAQSKLGLMYAAGDGVMQNFQEAFKWFQKAANQGDVNAQYNLGVMYHNGEGTEQNYQEAAKWYQKAAGQGHQNAEKNLASMHVYGEVIKQEKESSQDFRMSYLDEVFFDRLKNHYIDFTGKATRKVYWGFGICITIIWTSIFLLLLLLGVSAEGSFYSSSFIIMAAFFFPGLSVEIGRLHDINMSGWAILLLYIPFFGSIFFIVIGCIPSKTPTRWD